MAFPNAIRKYGPDAFSHEVLEVCYDLEVANLAEECWIEFYETRDPLKGFNLAKGGSSQPHPISTSYLTHEYLELQSRLGCERWDDPDYRRKSDVAHAKKRRLPEFRAALSESTGDLWQDPEYREKMSAISSEVNSRPEVKESSPPPIVGRS